MTPRLGWILLSLCLLSSVTQAQQSRRTYRGAESSKAVVPFVVETPLSALPRAAPWRPGDPIKEIPRRHIFAPGERPLVPAPTPRVDPLLETQEQGFEAAVPEAVDVPIVNRDGQSFSGANPPDTVGDVGLEHYIQVVNTASGAVLTVYDKDDGAVAAGPLALDSLSSAGNCSVGLGDGVVLYDHLADRWLLTEFNDRTESVCVYVSQTSNPVTSGWFAYEFATIGFPDYPKYAVWSDAYYLSTNESPSGLYALDRASMLVGAPAASQRFSVPNLLGFGFQAVTPGDLDGPVAPPAGSPGIFMRHRDTEAHGPAGFPVTDFLELWEFSVDWDVPADSILSGPASIPVTDFDSELCGFFSFDCIPQPSTSVMLDPLREVIMYRLQYRNFESHQTLVGNLVTDVDGTDHAGVRWFELRNSGTGWSLFQEGTYAPDAHHRWMGAISMDAVGNLALGYNISSSTLYPGLRYTGRLAGDPLGVLRQPELSLVEGAASSSSNRYGDYSAMSVDPVDDCTFWFTGQYNATSTWKTRIGSFRFDDCASGPGFTLNIKPPQGQVCSPAAAEFVIDVDALQGFTDEVGLSVMGEPAGTTASFTPNPVTAGGSSVLRVSGTGAVAPGTYVLEITGTAWTGVKTSTVELALFEAEPAAPVLTAPLDTAVDQAGAPIFTWSLVDGTSAIEIATDAMFANVVDIATGLTDTRYQPTMPLQSATTYYWRVWSENVCGVGAMSPVWSFRTVPLPGDCTGASVPVVEFFDDLESGAVGWESSGVGDTWSFSSARSSSGSKAWFAEDSATESDQFLVTPPIELPAGQAPLVLNFWNWQAIESSSSGCYDGAVLEISSDDGATWTRLEEELLTYPYDGEVDPDFGSPLAGNNAWCGTFTDGVQPTVVLNDWAGQRVRLRFRLVTDMSVGAEGWYIDDVAVTSCRQPLFSDGFEPGDSRYWSSMVRP